MRLSIIISDGTVVKDGVALTGLDLSFVDTSIHALQWYDTYGEIEYKTFFDVETTQIVHPQNTVITELPSWANQSITVFEQSNVQ
jgi:uncharacterized protein YprB with RNaseH-like and TPR domain